jgi:predicted metal-dependent peptidase
VNKKDKETKDKLYDSYDFERILAKFTWDEPFYSYFSRDMNKVETKKYPTAAVTIKNGDQILYYNNEYFTSIGWKYRFGLLQHEILHLVFQHVSSRVKYKADGTIDKLWFWCCDFAVNSLIKKEFVHDSWLYPGRYPKIPKELEPKFTQEELKNLEALRKEIISWPVGESADWYYKKMKQNPDAEKGYDASYGKDPQNGTADSHEAWVDSSGDDTISDDMKEKIRGALDECASRENWGSVPAPFHEQLRKLVSKEVDWRSVLKNFTGKCQSIDKISTIKKINKRYPYIHPGRRKIRTARIVVCIDQSGSMSSSVLELLFAELNVLSSFVEFVVVPFDAKVVEEGIFTWGKGEKMQPKRVASGGTDFSVPTRWVNENFSKFDAAIFLTDGYCSKPIACKLPRAWVITPNGKLLFETPELVIKMAEVNKNLR